MNDRPLVERRGRISTTVTTVLVVASITVGGETITRAQGGRAVNQRPPQSPGTPGNLGPYGMPRFGGWYSPYPVKDPTADERVVIAGRVYRAIVDASGPSATTTPPAGPAAPGVEARFSVDLIERLGPWSLRWQEAQDNAATTRAARYQAMSDHLRRMSALKYRRSEAAPRRRPSPDRPRSRGSSVRSISGTSTGSSPRSSSPSGRSIHRALPSLPPNRSRSRTAFTTRSWMKRSTHSWHRRAGMRLARTKWQSSTPNLPNVWDSGQTSGGNRRTPRPEIRPRDRVRLVTARLVSPRRRHEMPARPGPRRRCGRTSIG